MHNDHSQPISDSLSVLVRVLGLILLLIGLYIGIKVIFEAWSLYQEPQKIERFADAIAQGLHQQDIELTLPATDASTAPSQNGPDTLTLQVSYFIAWFLALLLMMVVGSLAASAMRTGGQLVLYDLQVKRFASQLLQEARQGRGPTSGRALRERDYE